MADNGQSKRPEDTDFKQQRLKAWQPILTPKWVISSFFVLGVIFIPIGIVILEASNSVVELAYRYDNEPECQLSQEDSDGVAFVNYGATCAVEMEISETMELPVYIYYQLTNFYQNHRRYVKSRSDSQLRGESDPDLSGCDPLGKHNDKKLYPCGLIAASYFSDQVYAEWIPAGGNRETDAVPLASGFDKTNGDTWRKNGIAWESDKREKFKRASYVNDSNFNEDFTREGPEQEAINTFLGASLPDEKLVAIPFPDDEDLIVWMRTAGLPTFKKLYRIINGPIDHDGTDVTELRKGDVLRFNIKNFFRVADFGGQKAIVASTTTWLGGKNSFLGYAYIIVGVLCVLLAMLFMLKHTLSPRKLGDMRYFKWHADDNNRVRRNIS